jgi:hypothetical protein
MRIAVFYPARSPSGSWLRQTLLYWDVVSSVVDEDFTQNLPADLAQLRRDGLYEPLQMSEMRSTKLHDEFMAELSATVEGLAKKLKSERVSTSLYLAPGKFPHHVIDELCSWRVAQEDRDTHRVYLKPSVLSPIIATTAKYLTLELSSPNRTYVLHTDQPSAQGMAFGSRDGSQDCLALTLREFLPLPGADVPLSQVIDFRNKHERELREFRVAIADLITVAASQPDSLDLMRDRLQGSLLALEAATHRSHFAWIIGSLAILLLTTATVVDPTGIVASAIPWVFSGIGVTAAVDARQRKADVPRGLVGPRELAYLTTARKAFPS